MSETSESPEASFEALLEQHMMHTQLKLGTIVKGRVVHVDDDYVTVAAGLKSESLIPISQFLDEEGHVDVQVGDTVDVALDAVEDGFGETKLSREKARRQEAWRHLAEAYEQDEKVQGRINGKVKGGFTVELRDVRAFLPGSLVDVRPVRDISSLEGKLLSFKVIKMDAIRNNVVVSRRAVMEEEGCADRDALLDAIQEGQEITGVVKNLTDYGAFVDLGGVDGLLHITDMSWKRVKSPGDVVKVGDELRVKILKFDRSRLRVSLGLKQLGDDPWQGLSKRYKLGTKFVGAVTNITDYGCFVELEQGVEGLVHVSEMDWTNKNVQPSKIVQLGQEVEVMVMDIDEERRRVSLGFKQCQNNPWMAFADAHHPGERLTGTIKSITDFGIFMGLAGGIDGLVHLSDIAWDAPGEEAVRQYRKGQEIEVMILSVDAERERISLGIKQLEQDPFGDYVQSHGKGTVVIGVVIDVDSRGATLRLADSVTGYIKSSDVARDTQGDARLVLKVDQQVEAKIVHVDKRNRSIQLSVRAKDMDEEAEALKSYSERSDQDPVNTMLGDLLKEKIERRGD